MSEEERLAAEWAAMAGRRGQRDGGRRSEPAVEEPPPASSTRTKSTACWASTTAAAAKATSRPASRRIINSALVSYERLPMLEIVFDRLVRMMSTSLRNFTSDNVEVSLDSISSIRFGDYLNSVPLPAMLAVFKAEEWDNYGLLIGRQRADLLDRRRAAGRPPRHRRDADRGPALHHDRAHAGRAHGRRRPRRPDRRLRPAVAGQVPLRPAGDQSALRRHRPAGQRRHPGKAAHRHGGPGRAARTAAALRDAGAGARAAAADVHGREVRPRQDLGNPPGRASSGRPRCRSTRCSTNSACPSARC